MEHVIPNKRKHKLQIFCTLIKDWRTIGIYYQENIQKEVEFKETWWPGRLFRSVQF